MQEKKNQYSCAWDFKVHLCTFCLITEITHPWWIQAFSKQHRPTFSWDFYTTHFVHTPHGFSLSAQFPGSQLNGIRACIFFFF